MSYFYDMIGNSDPVARINGNDIPELSEPGQIVYNLVTDGGRLASNIKYEGSVKGVKHEVTFKWKLLNKAHFDQLYNTFVPHYMSTQNMFINVRFDTYTPEGIKNMRVYAGSNMLKFTLKDTTERLVASRGSSYARGGANYDALYENVEVHFVEQ